jgi:prepilin-type N-terminal cleavage/methylation domain-containing protein
MRTKQTGFTLVEIAIVLVIIGLLLGGILKGQEMIVQAKVKNSIQDFSGVSAAFYGYQDRYRAIPGDDKDAATRWTTPTAAVSGNGDRILTGAFNAADVDPPVVGTAESILWWDHLRRSGFVTGSAGGKKPNNSFNGILGVEQGDGLGTGGATPVPVGPVLATGATIPGFTNLMLCSTNLPDKVAIALDVQMDDGNPSSGAVRGFGVTSTTIATADTSYAENGTNIYTLCRQF